MPVAEGRRNAETSFLLGNINDAQSQSLYDRPPYDAAADLYPVALLVDQDFRPPIWRSSSLTHAQTNLKCNQVPPTHSCALLNAAIRAEKITHVPTAVGGPARWLAASTLLSIRQA